MKEEEVDKKIKAHYQSKSLSPQQLSAIVNHQKSQSNWGGKKLLKYAALVLFLVSSSLLLFNSYYLKNNLFNKYAEEVTLNHLKDLKSDILSDNIDDLNTKMQKLSFDLYLPKTINKKYELLGGRYCSLDKRMAAQLKLRCKQTNVIATLYVLDKNENEEVNTNISVDSTAISIWNDESNLFVLALGK